MKTQLSNLELAVLEKAAAKMSNEQISDELSITKEMVKVSLTSIYEKLDVKNRLQAVLKYFMG